MYHLTRNLYKTKRNPQTVFEMFDNTWMSDQMTSRILLVTKRKPSGTTSFLVSTSITEFSWVTSSLLW